MHAVDITVLDPAAAPEGLVRGWYDVKLAALKVDLPEDPTPSWQAHVASLHGAWGGDLPITAVATDADGTVAAGYLLTLTRHDNLHGAGIEVVVHPDARRRGIGRALLGHATGQARAAGRRLLLSQVPEAGAGAAFLAAVGATRGLVEVRRVQDLGAIDPAEEARQARLLAEAERHSPGYSLLRWRGPVPAEHLADFADLMTRMSDAPTEDLDWGEEVWTPERVREGERHTTASGDTEYVMVARHDASGHLVAMTRIFAPQERNGWAFQGDTVVLPEHRGRRLGLRVKLSLLPWLRAEEPDVQRIMTWNAGSNAHMIAVNEAMGYRVLDRWGEWQLPI